MDQKIIEYYEGFEIPLERQIAKRPKGVTPGQIEAAAEFVYRNGNGLEPIMMAREIRRISHEIDITRYRGHDELAREATTEIKKFRLEVERLAGTTQRAVERFENIGWKILIGQAVVVLLALIAIGVSYD